MACVQTVRCHFYTYKKRDILCMRYKSVLFQSTKSVRSNAAVCPSSIQYIDLGVASQIKPYNGVSGKK